MIDVAKKKWYDHVKKRPKEKQGFQDREHPFRFAFCGFHMVDMYINMNFVSVNH